MITCIFSKKNNRTSLKICKSMRNKMLSLDVGKLICIELNIDFPSCYVYLQNVWSIYYNNVRESS